MQTFADLKDTLVRHLPRAAVGSPLSVSEKGVEVREPGVSIGDLAHLIEDLTGSTDFLPANLPVTDLRLQKLNLARRPGGEPDLTFTVLWDNASLAVAGAFPLRFARVDFTHRGSTLRAVADAKFAIDDYELDVAFELPSQVVSARLEPQQLTGATTFLAGRGWVAAGGSAKLREMDVAASLLLERVVVYVDLENLFTIGPVTLSAARAQVVLAGDGESSAAASAEVRIALANHAELVLDVEGEVDAHGWRLAGALDIAQGGFGIDDLAASFASHLNHPKPRLPDAIAKLAVKRIAAALDTHDASFTVDCTLDWQHGARLEVHLARSGGEFLITGSLLLNDVVLKIAFESGAAVLVGSYDAAGAKGLTLDAILGALSVDTAAALAKGGRGVPLGVRSLAVALDGQSRMLMAAEVDAGIDLSRLGELPLVGSLLPKGEPLGLRVTPYFMADQFAGAQAVRPLLPAGLALPDTLASGVHLAASLHLGGTPITLDGPSLGADASKVAPPDAKKPSAAAPLPAATLTWTDVNRKLGPLTIGRVGYATDDKVLDLAIDAGLEVAGLTVTVDGLGARYDFDSRALSPHLRGLGLDVKRGPLEIGGAFLNADGDFLGKVVISGKQFTLNASGAFMMLEGTPSMYAYGVLDMPLGGPAFFYVEGLAAGVGLHRLIRMPKIEDVRGFPLVADAGVKSPLKASGGELAKVHAEFAKLHEYVSPRLGEYFFAAGLKFNSFRLLHGFAVLVVSVGRDLEIDLIGTADFASPPELPPNLPALARIELDLLARFAPAEGLIAVEARLNPKSYVYGPLCHLSGGFAFYAWMAGTLKGDFVLSVGGYHPEYDKPAHYPSVPLVELKYQVTPDVYLKGDAYFALTPSIMMAGGGLHADVTTGALHAWADLSVDFWVEWEPFHYDARVHVGIGAQWKCFHTSASADLHIWGPDFSGTAKVDWWIFSFDVAFGPQTPVVPLPITMEKFKKSFLGIDGTPDSANATLGVVLAGGVIGDAQGRPVVAPADLVVGTSSRIPANAVKLGASDVAIKVPQLGVTPAAVTALGLSRHAVVVMREETDAAGKKSLVDVSAKFAAEALETGFPAALWGPRRQADRNARPISAVSELRLRAAIPPTAGQTTKMRVGDLQYERTLRASREAFMETRTIGPVPTALPSADLTALGLDARALVYAPVGSGRSQIELGGHVTGAGIA